MKHEKSGKPISIQADL